MSIDIKAALLSGMTPRALDDLLQVEHRRKIEAEIASGKWRCPKCREPMKLSKSGSVLFCDRSHDEKLGAKQR